MSHLLYGLFQYFFTQNDVVYFSIFLGDPWRAREAAHAIKRTYTREQVRENEQDVFVGERITHHHDRSSVLDLYGYLCKNPTQVHMVQAPPHHSSGCSTRRRRDSSDARRGSCRSALPTQASPRCLLTAYSLGQRSRPFGSGVGLVY